MCCLFGLVDYHQNLNSSQKSKIIRTLSIASEARGTDATGIAYNSKGTLRVYKRPVPAHKLRIHIPENTLIVMGHTRMTTQGSEKRNYNNHPFQARAGGQAFALAHNGMLSNDAALRKQRKLRRTNIETDSYVSVQLLEQSGAISFDSLRSMAELVKGTFSFTVLDGQDNLYFIKGDNPLCIYHYPKVGLYLYASTEAVLMDALLKIPYRFGKPTQVILDCGEILKIDAQGKQSVSIQTHSEQEYLQGLKSVASFYGFSPGYIDSLLADGFHTDDIEEMIYCGEI